MKNSYNLVTNNPIKKWKRDLKRHFFKEEVQIINKHMKRCSASWAIREMHTKSTRRYCLKSTRTVMKRQGNKYWQELGETGTLICCWWEHKIAAMEHSLAILQMVKHTIMLTYDLVLPPLGMYPRGWKFVPQKN